MRFPPLPVRLPLPVRSGAALAAVGLALAACGGGGGEAASTSPAASTSAASQGSWAVSDCAEIAPPTLGADLPSDAVVQGEVATTPDLATAPVVGVLEGAVPVTSLVVADVTAGSGEEVPAGATVTVQYCGIGLDSGAIFDSSWARGEPATFPLSGVIKGWQDGIPGMQPGGRRLLLIPGDLAYGDNPPPGSGILPGETLVFVVDLLPSA